MTTEEFKTNVEPVMHDVAGKIKEAAESFNRLCARIEAAANVPDGYMDPQEAKKEESESKITLEDIRAVLTEKTQDGLTQKIKELLQSFGASKLSKVPEEKYPELMAAAKALK